MSFREDPVCRWEVEHHAESVRDGSRHGPHGVVGPDQRGACPGSTADPLAHNSTGQHEVTIKGNVLSNVHTGVNGKTVFLLAYDGTPEIQATFEKIMVECYPDQGLDADTACKLQDQFMTRLKYQVDGPLVDAMWKEAQWTVRQVMAVTGVVSQKDGQKWITASKWEPASFAFPAKMLSPDKPLAMPGKEPLVLQINSHLSLRCIHVPAGTFLMGEPYYQCPHWQEDPPHRVTLTRSFYMSEIPITQEIYEAVTGTNPSQLKSPQLPVHNVSCADMYTFCELLSKKTGCKVRIPTAAEWEYAARVGTSNPTFPEKYANQNSNANSQYESPPLPVKSKSPNAWGFYDLHSGWWSASVTLPCSTTRTWWTHSTCPLRTRRRTPAVQNTCMWARDIGLMRSARSNTSAANPGTCDSALSWRRKRRDQRTARIQQSTDDAGHWARCPSMMRFNGPDALGCPMRITIRPR